MKTNALRYYSIIYNRLGHQSEAHLHAIRMLKRNTMHTILCSTDDNLQFRLLILLLYIRFVCFWFLPVTFVLFLLSSYSFFSSFFFVLFVYVFYLSINSNTSFEQLSHICQIYSTSKTKEKIHIFITKSCDRVQLIAEVTKIRRQSYFVWNKIFV